jgi:hypothetical protein
VQFPPEHIAKHLLDHGVPGTGSLPAEVRDDLSRVDFETSSMRGAAPGRRTGDGDMTALTSSEQARFRITFR